MHIARQDSTPSKRILDWSEKTSTPPSLSSTSGRSNRHVGVALLIPSSYMLAQLPSNMILTRVRPHLYLPLCAALWSCVSASTAATHSYGGLMAVRFVLGIVEAPFFPGVSDQSLHDHSSHMLTVRVSNRHFTSCLAGTPEKNLLSARRSCTQASSSPRRSRASSQPAYSRASMESPGSPGGSGCFSWRASEASRLPWSPSSSCPITLCPPLEAAGGYLPKQRGNSRPSESSAIVCRSPRLIGRSFTG
jgi:hypothetical protein